MAEPTTQPVRPAETSDQPQEDLTFQTAKVALWNDLNQLGMRMDADAEGEFPGQEPRFPVIWLVKGREQVPWGQRIQLN